MSRAPASRAESKLEVTKAVGSARETSVAIVGFGAYKRLRAVEPSSEDLEATG